LFLPCNAWCVLSWWKRVGSVAGIYFVLYFVRFLTSVVARIQGELGRIVVVYEREIASLVSLVIREGSFVFFFFKSI
jgi:hypothetical protein